MTDITAAAARLTEAIFGPHTAFLKLGRARAVDGELHVRTSIPESRWPKDRMPYFDGHPVRWVHVGKETAS
jgi:hypothetical protein